ncbi:MAG: flagellin [Natronohydrobacter sp.]|nr:flagellin [Natronohydrobacter sp.]
MSSILTNTSAMVALQTLRGINKNLAQTQSEISTGKSVATARDNAAVWAISKTMESDVKGFKAISDTLSLGSATVGVARSAAETVTDLLTQMKGLIVNAQEENVDRAKIQTDIVALREQVTAVIGAAQFNGLNLVDGTSGATNILASLDRAGGTVTASNITVAAQNLATSGYTAANVYDTASTGITAASDATAFVLGGGDSGVLAIAGGALSSGDTLSVTINGNTASYTVSDADMAATDTGAVVALGLRTAIEGLGFEDLTINYATANPTQLAFSNAAGGDTLTIAATYQNADAGGLGIIDSINVSTATGAAAALGVIETAIDRAIDTAAIFGSAQMRIDTQSEFVKNLTDALTSGIGALVDADMEAASARLQALQVQQQLATQSLSIANQQPQNILALFR